MKHFKKFFIDIRLINIIEACLGSVILAFGMCNIHSVASVTEGGTLGLSLFLENHFGISPSVSEAVMNTLCYIIGIKTLGKTFLIYSAMSTIGFSLSYSVFERFPGFFPGIADSPLLAAVLGALFVGVGVGLCVRAGGAPCGDDALAMSISAKTKMKIQWIYLISDLTVLLLSLSYIPVTKIVYSLLTVIISGQIIGIISKVNIKNHRFS